MLLTIKHFYTQGKGVISTLQIRWKIIMFFGGKQEDYLQTVSSTSRTHVLHST